MDLQEQKSVFFKIVVKNNKSGRAASNSYVSANPTVPIEEYINRVESIIVNSIDIYQYSQYFAEGGYI